MTNDVTFRKILAECCRLLLGVTFIFSGFVKAVDPMGGAIKIDDYLTAFHLSAFQSLSLILSLNLCALEFMLGICMLLGVYRRYTSFLMLLFMAFMTPLTLYLALFNPVSDCGCFGDALVLTNWQTFWKNVILATAAVIVFINNQRLFQCYSYKSYWFVALFTFLFCVCFAYYNYSHLPPIDFRPYKIGANIPKLMEMPEGAPQDVYEYSFVYEKNGKKKSFGLNDYPANDSTWKFVSQEAKLIKAGYKPPIAAFNVFDDEGNDVSDTILHTSKPVLLLIAPKLEKADDSHIDEINSLYDYSVEHKIPFWCLTNSTNEEIENWSDNTGAEYPYLMVDDVILKTMVRSNPGLMLLRDGTILGKWHYNNIPREEQIASFLKKNLSGNGSKRKEDSFLLLNLLSFSLPLLAVWCYDYFRNRRRAKKTA